MSELRIKWNCWTCHVDDHDARIRPRTIRGAYDIESYDAAETYAREEMIDGWCSDVEWPLGSELVVAVEIDAATVEKYRVTKVAAMDVRQEPAEP